MTFGRIQAGRSIRTIVGLVVFYAVVQFKTELESCEYFHVKLTDADHALGDGGRGHQAGGVYDFNLPTPISLLLLQRAQLHL